MSKNFEGGIEYLPEQPPIDGGVDISLLRHSKADYKSYSAVVDSENPDSPLDLQGQILPDVPQKGVELAQKEAEKFFAGMKPDEDALFFVSSSQARALETAKIYKDIAKEKGFTVITPEHTRNPLEERMDEREIRVLKTLSLKPGSALWGSIYNPPAYMPPINWEAVDPETKKKWDEARAIIAASDKGNWGANFHHYSDVLKEKGLLPETEDTANELFGTQFQQLKKMAQFGAGKAKSGYEGKNIRIIAVGHENYLTEAIKQYFGEEGINNCEVFNINVDNNDGISLTRRGETKEI
jgi:hypothetical protein